MEYLKLTFTHTVSIVSAMVLGTAIDNWSETNLKQYGPMARIGGQFAMNLGVLNVLTYFLPRKTASHVTNHIFFLSVLLNVQVLLFSDISAYFKRREIPLINNILQ
jgi:hypothetical protein